MIPVTETPITAGSRWQQDLRPGPRGKKRIRIIEVIAAPTLSNPVGFRVIRNDVHPHRKGKIGSMRASALRANFQAVSA